MKDEKRDLPFLLLSWKSLGKELQVEERMEGVFGWATGRETCGKRVAASGREPDLNFSARQSTLRLQAALG